ncbi:hypothetical protein RRSWK_01479 [Rhodopirellula sp. SWK7]|nr:hypothetical protein RRSWK_01479 [Rhodopirellula sp. SWK7]
MPGVTEKGVRSRAVNHTNRWMLGKARDLMRLQVVAMNEQRGGCSGEQFNQRLNRLSLPPREHFRNIEPKNREILGERTGALGQQLSLGRRLRHMHRERAIDLDSQFNATADQFKRRRIGSVWAHAGKRSDRIDMLASEGELLRGTFRRQTEHLRERNDRYRLLIIPPRIAPRPRRGRDLADQGRSTGQRLADALSHRCARRQRIRSTRQRLAAGTHNLHNPLRQLHARITDRCVQVTELEMRVRVDEPGQHGDITEIFHASISNRLALRHLTDSNDSAARHDDESVLNWRPADRDNPPGSQGHFTVNEFTLRRRLRRWVRQS